MELQAHSLDMGSQTQLCFLKNADEISELAADQMLQVTLYIGEAFSAHYVAFHAATNESGQLEIFQFYNEIYGAENDVRTYRSFEQNHGIWILGNLRRNIHLRKHQERQS